MYSWKFQAHYHSLTGTNDSDNVVKFSINRLIIKVDGRNINKTHTMKFAVCSLCLWNYPSSIAYPFFYFFCLFAFYVEPHPQHMELPRLGV
uniref:Uncharacterized protein n=1 Tax=Catagonus wagneri TaxID=51154 RepID=A0A8C3YUR7_9CETA